MFRVGIDIGGTFTDMLLVGDDGRAVIAKTLTTPGDPSLAVENALRPVLRTVRWMRGSAAR
jgi:N-methylhydantoinase A